MRRDLIGPGAQQGGAVFGLQLTDLGAVAGQGGLGLIQAGARRIIALGQHILALQGHLGQAQRGLGLGLLLGNGFQLVGALALLEIGQLGLGPLQLGGRLIAGGLLDHPVEAKQRRPGGDAVALLDRQLGEKSGGGRAHPHILALHIALQAQGLGLGNGRQKHETKGENAFHPVRINGRSPTVNVAIRDSPRR